MSVPVIILTQEQAEKAADLRTDLRRIKRAIENLVREQKEKQEIFDAFLHKVAWKVNEAYHDWWNGVGFAFEDRHLLSDRVKCPSEPVLSENGGAVVILPKNQH